MIDIASKLHQLEQNNPQITEEDTTEETKKPTQKLQLPFPNDDTLASIKLDRPCTMENFDLMR
jgi:hypothetical protein